MYTYMATCTTQKRTYLGFYVLCVMRVDLSCNVKCLYLKTK